VYGIIPTPTPPRMFISACLCLRVCESATFHEPWTRYGTHLTCNFETYEATSSTGANIDTRNPRGSGPPSAIYNNGMNHSYAALHFYPSKVNLPIIRIGRFGIAVGPMYLHPQLRKRRTRRTTTRRLRQRRKSPREIYGPTIHTADGL
jgi:hypothetical protein